MGKTGGSSWLSAVKRAFWSPTKEPPDKKTRRNRDDHELQEDEEKRREKRRWIFRKSSNQERVICSDNKTTTNTVTVKALATKKAAAAAVMAEAADSKQRHDLAVAMATTAAAQAAVATAQAAVEVFRLTRPSLFVKQHFAAISIQTAFRGYLARRALRALKGLVKVQALVRGHNVRKRAEMTIHCMQSLVRVQARARHQRRSLSYQPISNSFPTNHHPNIFRESPPPPAPHTKSSCRDESSSGDDMVHWDQDRQKSVEEIKSMLRETKEIALLREKDLAHAFSRQIWRPRRDTYASEGEAEEERPRLRDLDCYATTTRKSSVNGRSSLSYDYTDNSSTTIKTLYMDTSRPYSYSNPNTRHHQTRPRLTSFPVASPHHRTTLKDNFAARSPATPSPSKTTTSALHPLSPRAARLEQQHHTFCTNTPASSVPNYMAATESAKARIRSHSAPRQRASMGSGGTAAKKRLSFPIPDTLTCNGNNFGGEYKDDNYKGNQVGMEERSNVSCGFTDSNNGDDVSFPQTDVLRRWLR